MRNLTRFHPAVVAVPLSRGVCSAPAQALAPQKPPSPEDMQKIMDVAVGVV
jgi:hypothetical protein